MSKLLYSTDYGKYYIGKCEETIKELNLEGKVQLILTSPPFPLNNKKQYGNLDGEEYLEWFKGLAELFSSVLTPDGSIVAPIKTYSSIFGAVCGCCGTVTWLPVT